MSSLGNQEVATLLTAHPGGQREPEHQLVPRPCALNVLGEGGDLGPEAAESTALAARATRSSQSRTLLHRTRLCRRVPDLLPKAASYSQIGPYSFSREC